MSGDYLALQFDLDPTGSYRSNFGGAISAPDSPDPVYTLALPRILDCLDRRSLRATFFVIGQDLRVAEHARLARECVARGHEVANHSEHHLLGLAREPEATIRREISAGHASIAAALGAPPRGFRAPGWSVSTAALQELVELGYVYDASVLPTWTLVLQNALLGALSLFKAPAGGGDWRVAFAPTQPYFPALRRPWAVGAQRDLLEMPAGVSPGLRIPYYATFQLLHRSSFRPWSPTARDEIFCYVCHGLDFLDGTELGPGLERHPTGNLPLERKLAVVEEILDRITPGRQSETTLALAQRRGTAGASADART